MDRPELPVSRYQIPEGAVRLLTDRRQQPPYEIRARRKIAQSKRRRYDAALYAYATPDYILGASQSVDGLGPARLRRPGDRGDALRGEPGLRAALSLEPHPARRRATTPTQINTLDQAVASRIVLLARLDTPGAGLGHAFLSLPLVAARGCSATS